MAQYLKDLLLAPAEECIDEADNELRQRFAEMLEESALNRTVSVVQERLSEKVVINASGQEDALTFGLQKLKTFIEQNPDIVFVACATEPVLEFINTETAKAVALNLQPKGN